MYLRSSLVASVVLLLATGTTVGCGGDGGGGPATPDPIEGPYAMLFGAQDAVFDLSPSAAEVVCRPKPGLDEFEYVASQLGENGSSTLTFKLQGYDESKTSYDIEYAVAASPHHEVEVAMDGGTYRYVFFQALRSDTSETFNSHCSISLKADKQGTTTHYSGLLACSMLWADHDSADYETNIFNSFIDLFGKFECDY